MVTVGRDHEGVEYAIYWPAWSGHDAQLQTLGSTIRFSHDELENLLDVARKVIERFAALDPDRPRGVVVSRTVEYTAWED